LTEIFEGVILKLVDYQLLRVSPKVPLKEGGEKWLEKKRIESRFQEKF